MGSFTTLHTDDGEVRLYVAGADEPGRPGVVLLHAWWGLVDDLTAFADRLAGDGFVVLAPDLFGGKTAATVEAAEELASAADEDVAYRITLAAIDRLAARDGDDRIGIVGFSFGAAFALWAPPERPEVVATVVYYGTMDGPVLARGRSPVLGHFAETDPYEDDNVAAFEAALRTAGRDVEIHRYPGTGHWFAEPSRTAYRAQAAEEAYAATVGFLGRHLR